jgi:hypothetical protein
VLVRDRDRNRTLRCSHVTRLSLRSLPVLVAVAVLSNVPGASARAPLTALPPSATAALAEAPAPPPQPGNDEIANAQAISSLPATLNGTTIGATIVPSEPTSSCGNTVNSVWYTLHTSTTVQRIGVELAAAGKLDATVDVYRAVRSSLGEVTCQQTEEEGKASLTFKAAKNAVYEIRVAALADSQLASFTLSVFLPTPAVTPPGLPLRAGGASGQVDRIQNINAAYALTLHAGVSYMINLANRTKHGACVSGALFAPGTSSFEDGSPLLRIECGGYRLFTPGPGQGGRYSFEITPRTQYAGVQRFHLQVAPAGPDETAPGVALGNYGVAHAYLHGDGAQVLRLYRLDVTSHSNLTLRLSAPKAAQFNLRLLNQNGAQIACQCGARGSQKLQQKLTVGRYYVAVSARNGSSGSFTLERESRTITHTEVYFAGARSHAGRASAPAGRATPIHVRVTTGASGPVTVEVERFDPVFGWQFYRQVRARVDAGIASIPFTAPAVGRWRVNAAYAGSRVSSPSSVGFSYLLVS